MLTLALTHYDRFEFLKEALMHVQEDPRIDEIVISDDSSDDGSYEQIETEWWLHPKFKIYRNEQNFDSYINKKLAVQRATHPWVILFDSDNVMPVSYLDAIFRVDGWEPACAYLPVFAEPEFDYRAFENMTITRGNVAELMEFEMFRTALNTGNYLINRDEYLRVWDGTVTPHTSEPIYHNFRWLEAGNSLRFVPEMTYFHRMHDGSHFIQNDHKTGEFAAKVETLLRMLR